MQNAARNLVQHERFLADLDSVAGVGAALVADDPVSPLRQNVDELAFTLVAPLRANDDDRACFRVEHLVEFGWFGRREKQTPREVRGVGSIYLFGVPCQRRTGDGGGISSTTRGGSSGRAMVLIGSTTVNVEPLPNTLSAKTCPPRASTSLRVMLRPSPV